MKVRGKTTQPVLIDTNRAEAQKLCIEIAKALHKSGEGERTPLTYPLLHELWSELLEAERRYKAADYSGPG